MRIGEIVRGYVVIAFLASPFQALFAQGGPPQDSVTGFGPYANDFGQMRLSPGAPFVGTWQETSLQRGASGSMIWKEARDSTGRVYTETLFTNGTPFFWGVVDPSEHTTLSWSGDSRQAALYHDPSIVASKPNELPPSPFQIRLPEDSQWNWEIEQLGTKTIHGLLVEGIRATRPLPNGQPDNRLPAPAVSEERWYSRDLQLAVLIVYSDPRIGTFTSELKQIERIEPDPRLFVVPAGYEVVVKQMVSNSKSQ